MEQAPFFGFPSHMKAARGRDRSAGRVAAPASSSWSPLVPPARGQCAEERQCVKLQGTAGTFPRNAFKREARVQLLRDHSSILLSRRVVCGTIELK